MLEGNDISYSDGKVISADAVTSGTSYLYNLKEGYIYGCNNPPSTVLWLGYSVYSN
jgi:hypothetical protein